MLDIASIFANPAYWLIFIFMFFEGPLVTYVAALFALNGTLSIVIVIILSILGNLIPDTILYFLGHSFSKLKFVKNLSEKTTDSKFKEELHKLMDKSSFITIFIIKILPIFSAAGLFYLGKRRYNFKRYILNVLLVNLLLTGIIVLLAYSGTLTLKAFDKYLQDYQIYTILIVFILFVIFILWIYKNKILDFILKLISRNN